MRSWTTGILDEAGTDRLGRALSDVLEPGTVISLVGNLGAGKTRLVRAVVEGLGLAGENVSSPTFVLIHEYPSRIPVYHFDTYRVKDLDEFQDLGVDEYFYGEGICFVEWGDRMRELLPRDHLRIQIEIVTPETRQSKFEATGPRSEAILDKLAERFP